MPDSKPNAELCEKILEATQDVICEHHIAGTTIRKIADRLNISPALVLYYFPSKRELLLGVVDKLIQFFNEEINDIASNHSISPEEKLMLMLYREVKFITRRREETIILDFWVQSTTDDQIREKMNRIYANWEKQNNEVIRAGIESGIFDPVQAGWVSKFLISFVTGAAVQYSVDPGKLDLHAYFDQVYKVILRMLTHPQKEEFRLPQEP
jgi:TetR/AcrR family transcriptional regulator